jgi:predicted nucleic acid-binding protein
VTVVSNSSPLIALSQIGRLDLLGALFQQVVIPPYVAKEIEPTIPGLPGFLGVNQVRAARVPRIVRGSLGKGEQEAMDLALEIRASQILHDRPARRLAASLGLSVIGTLGVLLAAKRNGLVIELRKELDRLVQVHFFMDESLYQLVLTEAGE